MLITCVRKDVLHVDSAQLQKIENIVGLRTIRKIAVNLTQNSMKRIKAPLHIVT